MHPQSNQQDNLGILDKAKAYSRTKYSLAIVDTLYLLLILYLFLAFGCSGALASSIAGFIKGSFFIIPVYLAVFYIAYYILNFPLNFYRSFILEHKFSLSRQSISNWLADQFKSIILTYIIGLILLEAFYYILQHGPKAWWLWVSIFWIFFSLVMARLVPVIIIPLFFKYNKLSDDTLRRRILHLAEKMKVRILDVFEIDFSKKTLKANAAFVGWGKTRRVILADTLKDKYSLDEIEVILAHEFAHYKLKHLLKLILVNALVTLVIFYLIFKTNAVVLNFFSLSTLSDIAALPVIIIYFTIFGIITQPLENYISRRFEKDADLMAIQITGLKSAFISTMDKLASQNLADRKPHPIIKFFFFDHPPIDERVSLIKD